MSFSPDTVEWRLSPEGEAILNSCRSNMAAPAGAPANQQSVSQGVAQPVPQSAMQQSVSQGTGQPIPQPVPQQNVPQSVGQPVPQPVLQQNVPQSVGQPVPQRALQQNVPQGVGQPPSLQTPQAASQSAGLSVLQSVPQPVAQNVPQSNLQPAVPVVKPEGDSADLPLRTHEADLYIDCGSEVPYLMDFLLYLQKSGVSFLPYRENLRYRDADFLLIGRNRRPCGGRAVFLDDGKAAVWKEIKPLIQNAASRKAGAGQ